MQVNRNRGCLLSQTTTTTDRDQWKELGRDIGIGYDELKIRRMLLREEDLNAWFKLGRHDTLSHLSLKEFLKRKTFFKAEKD